VYDCHLHLARQQHDEHLTLLRREQMILTLKLSNSTCERVTR
jgi:hypothetical protein